MIFYSIGGLGADKRVFDFLELKDRIININWISPLNINESLEEYSKRISYQINQNENFGLIGVSFGGLIVVELNKILNPKISFIISSVKDSNQLPKYLIKPGKLGLINLIPTKLINPPQFILNFLFSAENKKLLKQIIKDTDKHFVKWALKSIVNWDCEYKLKNFVRIHGTKDRLIPLKGNAIKINGGGHFMIVDKAKEISNIINENYSNYK